MIEDKINVMIPKIISAISTIKLIFYIIPMDLKL